VSVEACTKFYREKHTQAAKVFEERYGDILARGERSISEWAAEQQSELYKKMRAAERDVDALWKNGVFDDGFKGQVLVYLRSWLEMSRLYAVEIKSEMGREVA
jgi:hypothetical protein